MEQQIAILDIGSNTFHLIIYRVEDIQKGFKEIYKEKIFVKLAEEGLEKIGEKSFERGLDTLDHYRKILDQYNVDKTFAFATAAMRTASNGEEFVQKAKEKTGIEIKIISGEKEAELIAKGVQYAVPFSTQPYLIMDIGGGSIELIAANKDKIYSSQSSLVGGAVLRRRFHQSEPISSKEIRLIEDFLNDTFSDFFKSIEDLDIEALTGASGSFDTIGEMLFYPKTQEDFFSETNAVEISKNQFDKIYEQLIRTTIQERQNMPGLLPQRADLIVVAAVAINFMLKKLKIDKIILSNYAMKEGILLEMMNKNL